MRSGAIPNPFTGTHHRALVILTRYRAKDLVLRFDDPNLAGLGVRFILSRSALLTARTVAEAITDAINAGRSHEAAALKERLLDEPELLEEYSWAVYPLGKRAKIAFYRVPSEKKREKQASTRGSRADVTDGTMLDGPDFTGKARRGAARASEKTQAAKRAGQRFARFGQKGT